MRRGRAWIFRVIEVIGVLVLFACIVVGVTEGVSAGAVSPPPPHAESNSAATKTEASPIGVRSRGRRVIIFTPRGRASGATHDRKTEMAAQNRTPSAENIAAAQCRCFRPRNVACAKLRESAGN